MENSIETKKTAMGNSNGLMGNTTSDNGKRATVTERASGIIVKEIVSMGSGLGEGERGTASINLQVTLSLSRPLVSRRLSRFQKRWVGKGKTFQWRLLRRRI